MGSCQSTEAASGVATETPQSSNNRAIPPKNGERRAGSQANVIHNTDSGTSHDDESIRSFSSNPSNGSKRRLGNSSGATTPDDSSVGSGGSGKRNPKTLGHSSSIIGLDSMIENRREDGDIRTNVVHMEVPFGKPIEEVYDGVHSGPVLGSGISGLVRLVTHKKTGHKYAVKCLDLGLVDTDEGLAQLREEIFIMCQLDHPNIVRLEEVYESHSEIYLVQELCLGGELFDRLDEQPDYHYTEAECARLIKQMLCAVRYLHSKGIIHRDLKLENFLFSSTTTDSELKMIDFGLSKHFRYGEVQHEAVGTPYTVAPEVIRGSYDEKCDIWAIGVISFLLLSGEPPFGGCGGPEPLMTVRSNILRGNFKFEPADIWGLVSQKAKEFINSLIVIDPKMRPTAREVQHHVWLREWANRTRTDDDNVLNPNVVKALVNFKEFSDMRKLLCEVLSFTLLPDQIKDLRKEFEKMDTDGSGEISLSALKQVLVTNASEGSLGALTEEEVEDIFNAMRVKKSETRIHWHEFIAAGLSQCQVDDRNLRLAFDRLDSDHKGCVTLDDIMNLVGNDSLVSEENMRKMWGDSMRAVNCNKAQITFDEFLLLMKGQTRESEESGMSIGRASLSGGKDKFTEEKDAGNSILLSSGDRVTKDGRIIEPKNGTPNSMERSILIPMMPLTPITSASEEAMDMDDTPLSMDDADEFNTSTNTFMPMLSLTPPSSPKKGAIASVSPVSRARDKMTPSKSSPSLVDLDQDQPADLPTLPPAIPKPGMYVRKRSRSFDNSDFQEKFIVPTNARRVVALPERVSKIKEKKKSVLQTNRDLYRAHRTMRLAVTEASKRFEEQQARHARNFLLAKEAEAEEEKGPSKIAGLVMRRVENKTVSSEEVKKLLEQNKKEQHSLVQEACRRGGRGRRTRKKTISDMSGMMGSLSQDDLSNIAEQAAQLDPVAPSLPSVIETEPESTATTELVRGATVPGEFKKVRDPFGAHGKYGISDSVQAHAANTDGGVYWM